MRNILKLLFTIFAFCTLTFSYANAASAQTQKDGMGQQDDENVDCIAINGGSGNTESSEAASSSSSQDDSKAVNK